MDPVALHDRAVRSFVRTVQAVPEDRWGWPSPNPGWDARAVVNHVVNEELWAPPLLEGATIADVGDRFDGDLLGDDPVAACRNAADAVRRAAAASGVPERTVHLSFGDTPAGEYLMQLAADHLIHGWDVAFAVGGDTRLEPDLTSAIALWFAEREDLYRAAGVIGPRVALPDGASEQDRLLAAMGRDPSSDGTLATIARFNDAFGRADVDAVMAAMTEDCVFEDTSPPGGRRHTGAAAVREVWEELFRTSPSAHFKVEAGVAAGDRATYQWTYSWDGGPPDGGYVRGIDLFRVDGGRIAEKLSYVKG
jgi:uncharacterized protein (TIGR03086 family)